MTDPDVLIVGAGPAGLAAACEIGRSGLSVEIVEQRSSIGGAIYRQPVAGVEALPQARAVQDRWRSLSAEFAAGGVPVRFACVFLGIDGAGKVLVEDRSAGMVRQLVVRAVIVAVGAVEKIEPRPGWQLAGITTAGGLQVMMKETGRPPAGRVLLAGSGPLLMAIAAQMTALGNPPVAIIEAGDPLRRLGRGLLLASHTGLLKEALGYLWTVRRARVPWLRGTQVRAISRTQGGIRALVSDGRNRETVFWVDRIGLHDGIRPNDFGLPPEAAGSATSPLILHAGDCREPLGAEAAIADGRRAAARAIRSLTGKSSSSSHSIGKFRRAQAILSDLFAPAGMGADDRLMTLPDETVLCRCENRTIGDLKRLCGVRDPLTGREVKHNGRFAMGACQGRFCAAATAQLMARLRPDLASPGPKDLTGQRWPIRPVSIAALVAGTGETETILPDSKTTKET